ncbi:hypothetical protein CCAX7_23980 [Capsulimonas corticalis]|uniref:Uncharacterized protein n=1 Tax=Capsulimonas corticalis TaxID=2219043 RepID=A0A402CVB9_9BACT|nr:hypothetical protein [Capsulimonas corticalis]BDI30347.1 hypothetical protein CCAX7_23980 [Capsulimonas corticalis]
MSEPLTSGNGFLNPARPDAGDMLVAGFTQALEGGENPGALLRVWSGRHPAFARDFAEAAAAHLGGDFGPAGDLQTDEQEISAFSRAFIRSRRGESPLSSRARDCGLGSLDAVAAEMRLPPGVLARLDRGRIALQTLPKALLEGLSQRLQWAGADLLAALQAPQSTPANAGAVCEAPAGYWAQETFAEALAECASEDPDGARYWGHPAQDRNDRPNS